MGKEDQKKIIPTHVKVMSALHSAVDSPCTSGPVSDVYNYIHEFYKHMKLSSFRREADAMYGSVPISV